jgi:hypothetical protein
MTAPNLTVVPDPPDPSKGWDELNLDLPPVARFGFAVLSHVHSVLTWNETWQRDRDQALNDARSRGCRIIVGDALSACHDGKNRHRYVDFDSGEVLFDGFLDADGHTDLWVTHTDWFHKEAADFDIDEALAPVGNPHGLPEDLAATLEEWVDDDPDRAVELLQKAAGR